MSKQENIIFYTQKKQKITLNTYNKNYILLIHQTFYFYFNSFLFLLNVVVWLADIKDIFFFHPEKERRFVEHQ